MVEVEWDILTEAQKLIGKSVTVGGWTRKPRVVVSVEEDWDECYLDCGDWILKFTFDDGKTIPFRPGNDVITIYG